LEAFDGKPSSSGVFCLSTFMGLHYSERIVMDSIDRTLLCLHVEAVWGVRLPSLMLNDVELLRDGSQPSWKLCAADQASGRVYMWRPDVTTTEREALLLRVSQALAFPPIRAPLPGVHREVALSLVASPRLDEATARHIARPLTEQDRALVEAFEPDAHHYYFRPERQPLIGVVISGQLLSLAHSSRRTLEACELGIDTRTFARRKGYALAATQVWTQAILQEGLVPIYSADASNIASLHLADAAGYRAFARLATFEE
jgi:RimJ/RimL family protein N-acetyltransferase